MINKIGFNIGIGFSDFGILGRNETQIGSVLIGFENIILESDEKYISIILLFIRFRIMWRSYGNNNEFKKRRNASARKKRSQ